MLDVLLFSVAPSPLGQDANLQTFKTQLQSAKCFVSSIAHCSREGTNTACKFLGSSFAHLSNRLGAVSVNERKARTWCAKSGHKKRSQQVATGGNSLRIHLSSSRRLYPEKLTRISANARQNTNRAIQRSS